MGAVLSIINPNLTRDSQDNTQAFLQAFSQAADAQGLAPSDGVEEEHGIRSLLQEVFDAAAPPAAESASPNVTFFVQYNTSGSEPVPCGSFNTSSGSWEEQPTGQRYDANGTAVAPSAAVQQLEAQLCSQPLAFGSQLASLVGGQDQQAQDWVQALLSAECSAAAAQALQRAFDVYRLSPGGLSAVLNPGPDTSGAVQLYAALNLNETRAACPGFNASLLAFNNSALVYDASGSATSPDPSSCRQLAGQICSDPEAAATQLVEAVKAGGDQAQTAAAAIKQALSAGDCSVQPALLAALDIVNPGLEQGNLDATRTRVGVFLQAFAQAADAVGLAACGAYAMVDTQAERIISQHHARSPYLTAPHLNLNFAQPGRPTAIGLSGGGGGGGGANVTGGAPAPAAEAPVAPAASAPGAAAPAPSPVIPGAIAIPGAAPAGAPAGATTAAAAAQTTIVIVPLPAGVTIPGLPTAPGPPTAPSPPSAPPPAVEGSTVPGGSTTTEVTRPAAAPGAPATHLSTALEIGSTSTRCAVFNATSGNWTRPSAPIYDATGTTPPPDPQLVAQLANVSCNATDQWVSGLPAAVEAGGAQAQAAVLAFNQSACDVMQPIVATLFGDNENFTAVKDFALAFVDAADAVGLPVCFSLALTNVSSGAVIQMHLIHTGRQIPLLAPPPLPDANGTVVAPSSVVQQLQTQICQQPATAGAQLAVAIPAGGQQSQDWTQALLSVDCVAPAGAALQAAYSAVSHDEAGLPAVQNFFSQLVAAADARGKPACASLAVIPATGPPTQYDFHSGKAIAGPGAPPGPPPPVAAPPSVEPPVVVTVVPPPPSVLSPVPTQPTNASVHMYMSLIVNSTTAICPSFDVKSLRWGSATDGTPLAYNAAGNASSPEPATTRQLAIQMCQDPSGAAAKLVNAMKAGSGQAQTAAAAVKQAVGTGSCSVDPVLLAALNIVNPNLDPGNLAAARGFLQAFSDAADAQGLAACGAYAIVDTSTGQITSQHSYHTGSTVAG
ncbi:hypothetical protein ABPG75_013683 [Micractinium tetrahymenae]